MESRPRSFYDVARHEASFKFLCLDTYDLEDTCDGAAMTTVP
jgi:hypothetical protein